MPPSLSIVLPAWNEAHRLGDAITALRSWQATGASPSEVEIIVVDDGSTDGTPEMARRAGARVLVHPENRGKGAAVKTGMLAARGQHRLFCDVDQSSPISSASALQAALLAGADVAVGTRELQARLRARRDFGRAALGGVFQLLTAGLGAGVRDTQCGFKMLTGEAAEAIFRRLRVDRYAFDVELLVVARRLGLAVAEVPVRWQSAAGSRVRLWRDGSRMLRDLVVIAGHDRRGEYR